MYNSIIHFIKKATKKIEKFMSEYLLSGSMLRFEEGLMDSIIEFGKELYQEVLESVEKTIRESKLRKQNYYVAHKEDRKTLL